MSLCFSTRNPCTIQSYKRKAPCFASLTHSLLFCCRELNNYVEKSLSLCFLLFGWNNLGISHFFYWHFFTFLAHASSITRFHLPPHSRYITILPPSVFVCPHNRHAVVVEFISLLLIGYLYSSLFKKKSIKLMALMDTFLFTKSSLYAINTILIIFMWESTDHIFDFFFILFLFSMPLFFVIHKREMRDRCNLECRRTKR
mgnify:CR=1 FL=1